MASTIFLGKVWHWGALVLATLLLWFCGSKRLHVIDFNWFMIALLAGTVVLLFAILRLHRQDEQVTREKLEVQPFDPTAHEITSGD